jgi:hypothetical protein
MKTELNINTGIKRGQHVHFNSVLHRINDKLGIKSDFHYDAQGELVLSIRSGHESVMLELMQMKLSGELEDLILGR